MKENNKQVATSEVLNSNNETAPVTIDAAVKKSTYYKHKKKPNTNIAVSEPFTPATAPVKIVKESAPSEIVEPIIFVQPKVIILKATAPISWFKKQYHSFTKWLSL